MMIWIMWSILFLLIYFFLFLFMKTTQMPNQKLKQAVKQKRFYMDDNKSNARKNFLLTYKGIVFEGEKHAEIRKNFCEVVSIYIWLRKPADINRLAPQDFFYIEKKILQQYPQAKINWNSPFYESMK